MAQFLERNHQILDEPVPRPLHLTAALNELSLASETFVVDADYLFTYLNHCNWRVPGPLGVAMVNHRIDGGCRIWPMPFDPAEASRSDERLRRYLASLILPLHLQVGVLQKRKDAANSLLWKFGAVGSCCPVNGIAEKNNDLVLRTGIGYWFLEHAIRDKDPIKRWALRTPLRDIHGGITGMCILAFDAGNYSP